MRTVSDAVQLPLPSLGGASMAGAKPLLLDVDKLRISYENQQSGEVTDAVRDVSLGIRHGEFVSIVGLSGCGKSSFLAAVAGLITPASGRISVEGRDVSGPGPERAVVFQKATLLPWRTVLDNITYGLELRGLSRKEARLRAAPVIDLVQLRGFERFHPGELSGGMQQRVNLARALVTEPRLLLLDEPFAALDAITRETMQDELLSIWNATRKSVLMVTHQIEEAVLLSDRVVVFSDRPARVVAEIHIDLPRPRTPQVKHSRRFDTLSEQVWESIHRSATRAGIKREGQYAV
ncbi:ABC transporter ATP-binding protein [Caballeronia sp. 15711]|uniref:ABC transporter ATP-binding protein n=1 Tax=Caballeronia sp. 15711 TaxID=3391029 RepID=UPI0039E2E379